MKQFLATAKASGVAVTTGAYAENVTFAIKMLHALFGAGNVVSLPTEI